MSYRFEVRSLLSSLSADRTVDGQFALPDVELGSQPYHFDGPVTFEVTLANTGAGIVADGVARVAVSTPCVRCLCETRFELQSAIEGFYVLPEHSHDLPEEQEFEIIAADMSIDLEPAIVQSIVVDLPFAPVHAQDCAGICPVCGIDRNQSSCACETASSDSPFAALRDLELEDPEA